MTNKKKGYANNPELAREAAYKSHEAWEANGRKPRGGFSNPDVQRRATEKAIAKALENRLKSKQG